MKISAFTLTTNTTKFGYPFIEAIKSWLPAVDELVVIDGGSTDGTIEAIQAIGSPKIRIVQDEDTKWEDKWSYARMGHNFNRGFQECTGDIVIKFDIDYVLGDSAVEPGINPKFNLRSVCEEVLKTGELIISFCRYNFVLADRHFEKKYKTLAVNKDGCKKRNVPVTYGLDKERWGFGYEPIVKSGEKDGINIGTLIKCSGNTFTSDIEVFNYGFLFSTKEQIGWARKRHTDAEARQHLGINANITPEDDPTPEQLKLDEEKAFKVHLESLLSYIYRPQKFIPIEQHPKVVQDLLKNLKPEQQGYNLWGNFEKAKYYD